MNPYWQFGIILVARTRMSIPALILTRTVVLLAISKSILLIFNKLEFFNSRQYAGAGEGRGRILIGLFVKDFVLICVTISVLTSYVLSKTTIILMDYQQKKHNFVRTN